MRKEELERIVEEAGFKVLEKKDGVNLYIISIKKKRTIYVIYGFQNVKREIGELSVIRLKRYVSFMDTYHLHYPFTTRYKKLVEKKGIIQECRSGVQLAELEGLLSQS